MLVAPALTPRSRRCGKVSYPCVVTRLAAHGFPGRRAQEERGTEPRLSPDEGDPGAVGRPCRIGIPHPGTRDQGMWMTPVRAHQVDPLSARERDRLAVRRPRRRPVALGADRQPAEHTRAGSLGRRRSSRLDRVEEPAGVRGARHMQSAEHAFPDALPRAAGPHSSHCRFRRREPPLPRRRRRCRLPRARPSCTRLVLARATIEKRPPTYVGNAQAVLRTRLSYTLPHRAGAPCIAKEASAAQPRRLPTASRSRGFFVSGTGRTM